MPPFVLGNLTMVIQLRSDQARGRYTLKVRPEDPSGIQLPVVEVPAHLEGGIRPLTVQAPLQLAINLEKLYWFDVLFHPGGDEPVRLVSRIPLEIVYAPQRSP